MSCVSSALKVLITGVCHHARTALVCRIDKKAVCMGLSLMAHRWVHCKPFVFLEQG